MADKDDDLDLDIDLDVGEGGSKKGGKNKMLLFILLPLILIIGGAAGLYFTGAIDGLLKPKAGVEDKMPDLPKDQSTGIFYDVPDIIVNLNTRGSKPRFLKISISLELSQQRDMAAMDTVMPRVADHFQTYLRELRVEDLQGSAGIYRLRLELLARVNEAARPLVVRDILFREILIQ